MTNKKAKIQIAYDFMKNRKKAVSFVRLWEEVSKDMTDEEKAQSISEFYTELTLDGRFITFGDNLWNLKEKYKSTDISKFNSAYVEELVDDEKENEEKDLDDSVDSEEKSEDDYDEDEENEDGERQEDRY